MAWFDPFVAILEREAPLAPLTWYRLGGPAEFLFTPRDEAEAADLVRACREAGVAWRVLGRGANLLVRDEGVRGAVLRLAGPAWEAVTIDGLVVRAAAGADFPKLIKKTINAGLAGLETLAGVPGTVGGLVRMNAGGKYGCIADFAQTVRIITIDGAIADRPADSVGFRYRGTNLAETLIAGAVFRLAPGEPALLNERHREIWTEKHRTQPTVSARSSGCVFKNPPDDAAGRLLDVAGLKGCRVGGAEISEIHANFIVATADATAQNVLDLINLAKERVWRSAGIRLETEVEIW